MRLGLNISGAKKIGRLEIVPKKSALVNTYSGKKDVKKGPRFGNLFFYEVEDLC